MESIRVNKILMKEVRLRKELKKAIEDCKSNGIRLYVSKDNNDNHYVRFDCDILRETAEHKNYCTSHMRLVNHYTISSGIKEAKKLVYEFEKDLI